MTVPVTARALFRRLLLIYVLYATLAIMAGVTLLGFGLDFTWRQVLIGVGILVPLESLAVVVADLATLRAHWQPIGTFLRALEAGQPAPNLARQALSRALNFPLLTVFRIMVIHGPTAAVSGTLIVVLVLNPYFYINVQTWQLIVFLSGLVTVVPAHAIFEYFAVIRALRPVIPVIQQHCGESASVARVRVIPLDLRRKLLFLSIFITLVPLSVLGLTSGLKFDNLLGAIGVNDALGLMSPVLVWISLLITFSAIVTVGMSVLMAREVGELTGDMVRAMRRVKSGVLDTRLEVTTSDEFADLYEGFNDMTGGLQERERLRDAFGRYVAPELAEQVMKHGVSLGGQAVNATVLFADIRGFTALSDKLPPAAIVGLLNGYFAAVEPAIEAQGGWINKFGGDSLLAVFGAPLPQADHACRAMRAALGMQAAVARFNDCQCESGRPTIRIGIGIHTGEVIAGNVGSPARMEYTVIGDIVNVASRIDGLNKEWGTEILVSAEAYALMRPEVSARAMPLAEVKGKPEPIQVYAL